jgi:hypothetical protein
MSQELLTWREATTKLGWADGGTEAAGRRLKRAVLARELQSGKQIATRISGGPDPQMRVTLSALHRHLPELRRSRVDQLSGVLAEYHADTDRRVEEAIEAKLAEAVDPRLEELWQRDEKLALEVERNTRDINRLSRAHASRGELPRPRPNPPKSDRP